MGNVCKCDRQLYEGDNNEGQKSAKNPQLRIVKQQNQQILLNKLPVVPKNSSFSIQNVSLSQQNAAAMSSQLSYRLRKNSQQEQEHLTPNNLDNVQLSNINVNKNQTNLENLKNDDAQQQQQQEEAIVVVNELIFTFIAIFDSNRIEQIKLKLRTDSVILNDIFRDVHRMIRDFSQNLLKLQVASLDFVFKGQYIELNAKKRYKINFGKNIYVEKNLNSTNNNTNFNKVFYSPYSLVLDVQSQKDDHQKMLVQSLNLDTFVQQLSQEYPCFEGCNFFHLIETQLSSDPLYNENILQLGEDDESTQQLQIDNDNVSPPLIFQYFQSMMLYMELTQNLHQRFQLLPNNLQNAQHIIESGDFKSLLSVEDSLHSIYLQFIQECKEGVESILSGTIESMFYDGLFYTEGEEFLYKNVILISVSDSTSTEYAHLQKEIKIIKVLQQLNVMSRALLPLACILRTTPDKLFLCYSVLPVQKDAICYGLDPNMLFLHDCTRKITKTENDVYKGATVTDNAHQNNPLKVTSQNQLYQLKYIIDQLQQVCRFSSVKVMEHVTKQQRQMSIPIGPTFYKNSKVENNSKYDVWADLTAFDYPQDSQESPKEHCKSNSENMQNKKVLLNYPLPVFSLLGFKDLSFKQPEVKNNVYFDFRLELYSKEVKSLFNALPIDSALVDSFHSLHQCGHLMASLNMEYLYEDQEELKDAHQLNYDNILPFPIVKKERIIKQFVSPRLLLMPNQEIDQALESQLNNNDIININDNHLNNQNQQVQNQIYHLNQNHCVDIGSSSNQSSSVNIMNYNNNINQLNLELNQSGYSKEILKDAARVQFKTNSQEKGAQRKSIKPEELQIHLATKVIPLICKQLMLNKLHLHKDSEIKAILHSQGINLKYMGLMCDLFQKDRSQEAWSRPLQPDQNIPNTLTDQEQLQDDENCNSISKMMYSECDSQKSAQSIKSSQNHQTEDEKNEKQTKLNSKWGQVQMDKLSKKYMRLFAHEMVARTIKNIVCSSLLQAKAFAVKMKANKQYYLGQIERHVDKILNQSMVGLLKNEMQNKQNTGQPKNDFYLQMLIQRCNQCFAWPASHIQFQQVQFNLECLQQRCKTLICDKLFIDHQYKTPKEEGEFRFPFLVIHKTAEIRYQSNVFIAKCIKLTSLQCRSKAKVSNQKKINNNNQNDELNSNNNHNQSNTKQALLNALQKCLLNAERVQSQKGALNARYASHSLSGRYAFMQHRITSQQLQYFNQQKASTTNYQLS